MDKVHTHVQYLHNCQLTLLITALSVGVTLGSAYLLLSYHSTLLGKAAGELIYWRIWMAALPGFLAIAISSMITQKISSVARNESFLAVLKDCRISGKYPREYRGWESAYRKLKYIHNSHMCQSCKKGRCGEFTDEEKTLLNDKKMAVRSLPNVFHIIAFGILAVVGLLSSLAVGHEVLRYKFEDGTVLGLGVGLGIVVVVFVVVLSAFMHEIRVGKLSFPARKRLWADILEKCPYEI